MQIDQRNIDALNAVLDVTLEAADYRDEVERVLRDYRKTASLPGFRKGRVPMGLLRRQHGPSITAETVEKRLQRALTDYIAENKLNLLGQPLPLPQRDVDWNVDVQHFAFEIGLAPAVKVDLSAPNDIVTYDVVVDEALIDSYITKLREQHGEQIHLDTVCEGVTLIGSFEAWDKAADRPVEGGISHTASFPLRQLGAQGAEALLGARADEVRLLDSKGLFEDPRHLSEALHISGERARELDVCLRLKLLRILEVVPAALDTDFFDAVYGSGVIKSEVELRERVKADYTQLLTRQSEQRLFNDIVAFLVDHTPFELPHDFLTRWIRFSQSAVTTQSEAEAEYAKVEKNLRWQIIEAQLAEDYQLDLTPADIEAQAAEAARGSSPSATAEALAESKAHLLQDQEAVKHLTRRALGEKLFKLFKTQMTFKTETCSFDQFLQAQKA